MLYPFIFILLGLIGLWLGTKWIINGALGIAKKFNLSHSFVGVAILAVGTDLPEVFVSLKASYNNLQGIESSGIITGNAIGSSISQITFILGAAGLFLKFNISNRDLIRDGLGLLGSIGLLFIFGLDGIISRWEGIILILMYMFYYVLLMKGQQEHNDDNSNYSDYSFNKIVAYLFFGLILLIYSSHIVVDNAMSLASNWGVAQSFVGIVIVGLGTSLPELAVSIGAAFRKSAGMSVGNIIGSNIFDGLIPIGVGGAVSKVYMDKNLLQIDLPFLFLVTILVLFFLRSKRGISTLEGTILICIFFIYLTIKWIFI